MLRRRLRHARERAAGADQNAKRLIVRKIADPMVQADTKLWPFNVLSSSDDKLVIQVQLMRVERAFHPGEISSMVFTKMKQTTETYLDTKVNHAVASESQRQATKDTEPFSDLNVLRGHRVDRR